MSKDVFIVLNQSIAFIMLYNLRMMAIVAISVLFVSCQEEEAITPTSPAFEAHLPASSETLKEPRLFTEGLFLPVGTRISASAGNASEIKYELPPEYRTLWYNANSGELSIEKSAFGGYSCKCSGSSGSCTVFHTSQTGYGCLQSDCSGSCTGTPKKDDDDQKLASSQRLVGIIYYDGQLDVGKPTSPAQIVPGFEQMFLEIPEIAREIKENYDFVYANENLPDFEQLAFGDIPAGFALLTASIHGVSFGMILPADGNDLTELFPASALKIASGQSKSLLADYTCTSSTSGCACVGEKKCKFGYCIYTCGGCGVCNLEVEK